MAEVGRNPARIIPAWRGFLDEHGAGGRPVRGIGEPVWAGRRTAEVTECQFHEALLNLAVEPHVPLWLLCPYDVEALAPDVVTEAHRSHPALVDVDSHRGSTLYGGSHHVRTVFASDAAARWAPGSAARSAWTTCSPCARTCSTTPLPLGCRPAASADLALAVHEVAANSLEHARGRGVLRIWQDDEALVCEIRDVGRIQDPLVGRTLPAWDDEGGRGLWMANHLCDLVQVRSGRSALPSGSRPGSSRSRAAPPHGPRRRPGPPPSPNRTARGKQDPVPIDRDHIVQVLRQRGDEDHARDAEQSLPAQVDPAEHADALERLGLNPAEPARRRRGRAGGQARPRRHRAVRLNCRTPELPYARKCPAPEQARARARRRARTPAPCRQQMLALSARSLAALPTLAELPTPYCFHSRAPVVFGPS